MEPLTETVGEEEQIVIPFNQCLLPLSHSLQARQPSDMWLMERGEVVANIQPSYSLST